MIATSAETIGNVFLLLFGIAVVGFVLLMVGSLIAAVVFRGRRWYRIVKDGGREYDSDGLRIRRDPEHGPYYVRAGIVLMPLRQLGTGWLTGDPKWCVAYNGMSDRLFIARRARAGGRVPRHLRGIEELDDWRSTMQEIDHRAHPWRAKDPNDT